MGNFAVHRETRNVLYLHSGILRIGNEKMLVSRPHLKQNIRMNS